MTDIIQLADVSFQFKLYLTPICITFSQIRTMSEMLIRFLSQVLMIEFSARERFYYSLSENQITPETPPIQCMHFSPFFINLDLQPQHYLAPYFLTSCATAPARSSASARVLASAYTRTASSVPDARAKLLPSLYFATTFSMSFCAPAGVSSSRSAVPSTW
jgi:hypothetical protein